MVLTYPPYYACQAVMWAKSTSFVDIRGKLLGTVTNTQKGVHRLVYQYRWYKTRRLISDLMSMDLKLVRDESDKDGVNKRVIGVYLQKIKNLRHNNEQVLQ